MRLPLQNTIRARQGSEDKDSTIINGFVEVKKSGSAHTIKRPGLSVQAEGTGVASGTFYYEGVVYAWDENTPYDDPLELNAYYPYGLSSNSFWSSTANYETGDVVAYPDEDGNLVDWTAQRDNTGVVPVQGEDWNTDLGYEDWDSGTKYSFGDDPVVSEDGDGVPRVWWPLASSSNQLPRNSPTRWTSTDPTGEERVLATFTTANHHRPVTDLSDSPTTQICLLDFDYTLISSGGTEDVALRLRAEDARLTDEDATYPGHEIHVEIEDYGPVGDQAYNGDWEVIQSEDRQTLRFEFEGVSVGTYTLNSLITEFSLITVINSNGIPAYQIEVKNLVY